jgi:hypothetical protein
MAQPQVSLYESIKGLSVQKYDFKAKAQALQNSTNELADQCERKIAECQSAIAQLLSSYDQVIKDANTEATKIKAEATKEAAAIVAKARAETTAWETEKAQLAHTQEFQSQIKLSIGGVKMVTSLTTLRRFPDSMIGRMFSGRHALPLDDEGFKVDLPDGQLDELKRECEYYGLKKVMFPWKAADPVTVPSTHGQQMSITQAKDGLWYGNNVLLKVCRSCYAAEGKNYKYCIENFVSGRGIFKTQPQPTSCSNCAD